MSEQRKVAIITGGAQGIGKATTYRLLREGWAVVMADIDEEAGQEAVEEYREVGPILSVPTDAGDEGQLRQAIDRTAAHFGGIDLVMNNAYDSVPWQSFDHITLEMWNRLMKVNLTSIIITTQHALPYLRERRGCIVNIASILALRTYPNVVPYSTSKGAIIALSHALAISLGPEIRVNSICPGMIITHPWRKKSRWRAPNYEDKKHQHPVGRMGMPPDIAAMVAFLVSADAEFITGENFVVDGGVLRKSPPGGDEFFA